MLAFQRVIAIIIACMMMAAPTHSAITSKSAVPVYNYGNMVTHYTITFQSGMAYTATGAQYLIIKVDFPPDYWVSSDVGGCDLSTGSYIELDSKSGDTVFFKAQNVNIPSGTTFTCDVNKIQHPNNKNKVNKSPFRITVLVDATTVETSGDFAWPYWTRTIPKLYFLTVDPILPRADGVRSPVRVSFQSQGNPITGGPGAFIMIDVGAGWSDAGVTVSDVVGFTPGAVTTGAGFYVKFGIDSDIPLGTNVSFTLSSIRNPKWGGTKQFDVTTFQSATNPVATALTSPYYEDEVGDLSLISISPSKVVRGVKGVFSLSFNSTHVIIPNSHIVVTMHNVSKGFVDSMSTSAVVADSAFGASTATFTFSSSTNTSVINITRSAAANIIPAGNITITLADVSMPDIIISHAVFHVAVLDSHYTLIDEGWVNASFALVAANFTASVSLSTSDPGVSTSLTVSFKLNNTVGSDGYFVIYVPASFDLSSVAVKELGETTHGSLSISTSSEHGKTVLKIKTSTAVLAGDQITFELAKLKNPLFEDRFPISVAAFDNEHVPIAQSVVSYVHTVYPNPVVTAVSPATGVDGLITVHGRFFNKHGWDLHSHSQAYKVMVGSFECTSVNIISDNELTCKVSGSGANQPVIIKSANRQSGAGAAVVDFVDVVTTGLKCTPPNGAQDIFNPDMCNCFSGYAPADELAKECSISAHCPGATVSGFSVTNSAPSPPKVTFGNDKIKIVQTAPIVSGRRDTHIELVNAEGMHGAETCNYPGSIWTKTVSSLDCLDVYTAVLPWSQHEMCGFSQVVSSDLHYNEYQSYLVTTYRDVVKKSGSPPLYRVSSNTYAVKVLFQRQITAVLSSTSISSAQAESSQIDVAIVDDVLMDPATGETFITFDTTASYPYQLTALTGAWNPSYNLEGGLNVTISISLTTPQPGNLECRHAQGEPCEQRWVMKITPGEVCNLRGTITMTVAPLVCRDNDNTSPEPCLENENADDLTITISDSTELCAENDVDASQGISPVVSSFQDSEFTQEQNTFQPADLIYIQIAVSSPLATIDALTINSVTINPEEGEGENIYHISPSLYVKEEASFNVTNELKTTDGHLMPGQVYHVAFQFILSRRLDTLSLLSGESTSIALNLEIVIDVKFHGNDRRKRIVANMGDVYQHTASHAILLTIPAGGAKDVADDEVVEGNEYDESLWSSTSYISTRPLTVILVLCLLHVLY